MELHGTSEWVRDSRVERNEGKTYNGGHGDKKFAKPKGGKKTKKQKKIKLATPENGEGENEPIHCVLRGQRIFFNKIVVKFEVLWVSVGEDYNPTRNWFPKAWLNGEKRVKGEITLEAGRCQPICRWNKVVYK